jgi:Flp pilus assembly protein TadB
MTVGLLLAAAAGAVVAAGLVVLAVEVRGREDRGPVPPGLAMRLRHALSTPALASRWAGSVVAGVVVLLLTRWPVAAAGIAALVLAWPALFGATADVRAQIARLEALAAWAESLKDTIAGAIGLEAAIPRSIDVASPLIRAQLVRLTGRLRSRMPIDQALGRFADELDNPSADLIIAALMVNARLRGPGLHQTLDALSRSAREELDMQRRVEAQRRGIRRGAQLVVAITVVFAVGLGALSRQYVAPYGSPTGQLVLAAVIGIFAAGFGWLRALSRADLPDRFLGGAALPATVPAGVSVPGGRT